MEVTDGEEKGRALLAQIRELLDVDEELSDGSVTLTRTDNGWTLKAKQMYEYVGFKHGVSVLRGMSEIARIIGCSICAKLKRD